MQLQRENALDDVACCAEPSHALTVDNNLDAAGIADPKPRGLPVELANRPGRKRTLHANIPVNRHSKP